MLVLIPFPLRSRGSGGASPGHEHLAPRDTGQRGLRVQHWRSDAAMDQ